MEESVFFGNEGLTSTSASYYANIAKESIQGIMEGLNNARFYEVSVASIDGNSNPRLMTAGMKSVGFIKEDLEKVANMNSFCAWIREAIKKKDEMISYIYNYDIESWAEDQKISLPKEPDRPNKEKEVFEEDVINSWDRNKRNKYLKYEAFAATYGKYIHPKGAFSNARKDVHNSINNPIYKEGTGRDLILYYQNPTVSIEEIDNLFMSLQGIYRSYEKELNSMKAEIKETVNKLNSQRETEFQERMAKFKEEYDKYSQTLQKLRSQFNSWKISEQERISKLKIVLPSNLLEIFEEIKKQGDSK